MGFNVLGARTRGQTEGCTHLSYRSPRENSGLRETRGNLSRTCSIRNSSGAGRGLGRANPTGAVGFHRRHDGHMQQKSHESFVGANNTGAASRGHPDANPATLTWSSSFTAPPCSPSHGSSPRVGCGKTAQPPKMCRPSSLEPTWNGTVLCHGSCAVPGPLDPLTRCLQRTLPPWLVPPKSLPTLPHVPWGMKSPPVQNHRVTVGPSPSSSSVKSSAKPSLLYVHGDASLPLLS